MRRARTVAAPALLFAVFIGLPCDKARASDPLTFEQRVDAQLAIDRVVYSHQIGAALPFESVMSREQAARKVRLYLGKKSVDRSLLEEELRRITSQTRMPERLRELFAALGNDPLLILETLVRPLLAGDVHLDGEALVPPLCDAWTATSPGPGPQARQLHSAVWTGSHMIIFGGWNYPRSVPGGWSWDPVLASWYPLSSAGAPGPRRSHSAVWTGTEMVIWGGFDFDTTTYRADGARYDPISDSWTPLPPVALGGRHDHTAVWTGSQMILWGGAGSSQYFDDGARWSPSAGWSMITLANAPAARGFHGAVWTGQEMIVWGGYKAWPDGGPQRTGGRYNPSTDTWTPTSTAGAPSGRTGPAAVWTGSRMLIWGGAADFEGLGDGASYDPVANQWSPLSMLNAPSARAGHTGVWANGVLLIWGGGISLASDPVLYTAGGQYDPATDTWLPTTTVNAPVARFLHTAVFTGSSMIVWGGESKNPGQDRVTRADGGTYVPDSPLDMDGDGLKRCEGDCDDADPSVYPGAPQVCDGVNNDCDDPEWPSIEGTPEVDEDDDGVLLCEDDCDDADPAVYPGAPEACDGVNNDCDDPGWPSIEGTPEVDEDDDGVSLCGGDCDDAHASVRPGAPQICDGLNNDCLHPAWPALAGTESDGDGDQVKVCEGDCNDGNPAIRPGGAQVCDGVNNDCLFSGWPSLQGTNEHDGDGDGASECAGDCDDGRAVVFPGAPELCDGVNNDCADPSWPAADPVEGDADGDGYFICEGDCDDAQPTVYPYAPQLCQGLNNDCTDPQWPTPPITTDTDQDGQNICEGDCDDHNPAVYVGAPQICDGLNNDCSTWNWPSLWGTNEMDADGDGFTACQPDCNDENPSLWDRPGDVRDLRFLADGETLTWQRPDLPGSTALRYDVLRFELGYPWPSFGQAECRVADTLTQTFTDPVLLFLSYFLVRAENDCGQGPAGFSSAGLEIPLRSCP